MKVLLISVALFFCAANFAYASTGWITVATTDEGGAWEAQAGSLNLTKNRGDTLIAVVIGRVTQSGTNTVSLYKWYVPVKDCAAGNGTIVSLNISGEYEFENDFVLGGGNVASAIAAAICGAAKQAAENAQKKSM
ncbi:hypothetical protein [Salinisphaera sp. T5B8]|uniref:hypothetical protein n=1 Tax=Salinisphaera sp. T5B8 TaxID=1304154 RepID=UPI00333EE845